jgi:Asp-tRNA(Asn)/Glu-tRNA(Gln) amidotransferase C subunit
MKIQKEMMTTKMELEKYAPAARDLNTKKTVEILQAEVSRLQKYIARLSEVDLPK